MELYMMSNLELTRLDFIKQHLDRKLTQAQVASNLGLSIRQIQRLVRNYKNSNYNGLISKKRGKPSNNFISTSIKARALEIIHKQYSDFGFVA